MFSVSIQISINLGKKFPWERLCIFTFFLFSEFGLYLLNGFYFYFDLVWMAWQRESAIAYFLSACLQKKRHARVLSIRALFSGGHHLNNRVFLSRNYRLIVAPRKFDVLKTNVCPRSEASRPNMLVLRTSNFRGATTRTIVPRHKHSIVFIVPH